MVIIVGNLSYQLMTTLYGLFTGDGRYNTFYLSLLTFVDIVGIIGVLWLLRSYRRTIRALKIQKKKELEEEAKKNGE